MKVNNYNGFKSIIENIISKDNMVEPSEEKFEEFIAKNALDKKEISKEVSGIKFGITTYYVNSKLEKIEVVRNGATIYNGHSTDARFSGLVSQLSKQLEITL
jgi:hypothetical protein